MIYLAHAFLEVRGEAAGDDRATAVHTLDDIGGDDGVRLAEHVDPALAPALLGGPASTGVVVVVASGGGEALGQVRRGQVRRGGAGGWRW